MSKGATPYRAREIQKAGSQIASSSLVESLPLNVLSKSNTRVMLSRRPSAALICKVVAHLLPLSVSLLSLLRGTAVALSVSPLRPAHLLAARTNESCQDPAVRTEW